MKLFKLWDYESESWIEDDIDKYVEFNWTLPSYEGAGEGYVDIRHGVNIEVVWKDSEGNFISPE